jgi:hypothetical protein
MRIHGEILSEEQEVLFDLQEQFRFNLGTKMNRIRFSIYRIRLPRASDSQYEGVSLSHGLGKLRENAIAVYS